MKSLMGMMAFLLLAPGSLWAGVQSVKGIDVVVKKQPTGTAVIRATPDEAGRIRFEIPQAGTYLIEAYAGDNKICPPGSVKIGTECFVKDNISLGGNFTRRGPGEGNPVKGKYVGGDTLFAAGSLRGDGRIFSVEIEVTAPVAFVGMLEAEDDIFHQSRPPHHPVRGCRRSCAAGPKHSDFERV